jgi:4-amino-4-deoxy-L-arabinose transferase-like glycosyltransferase
MGNTFYAAAVKSGTESWKAFLFGSFDPGSFITVDKPPAALWLMELSTRAFGFSTWSMLVPEALAGVATVLILYHLVRRWMGEVAAVLAGSAMALTPVAVLMFRYNNPDAFLTLLLVGSAWALWSALETARTWKLVACGAILGLAFTTKMLQALIVLPAFALVYLLFGPPKLGRRVIQLLWAGLALAVAAGWWVALVELWSAGSRPYVGGSTGNSELNLIFGYNGFSRIFGSGGSAGGPSTGGPGGGAGFAGTSGLLRVFNAELGGQIVWLVPLALVGLVAGLWWTRRMTRTDRRRAGYILWGGWALLTLAVFSEAQGIFHPYYTVALAPALAALVGGGSVTLWQLGRTSRWLGWVLPAAVLGTGVLAAELLSRTPGYDPGLATGIVIGGIVAAAALCLALFHVVRSRWFAIGAATLAVAVALAGPTAYSITTLGQATTGGDPEAGPTVSGTGGFPGAVGGGFPGGAAGVLAGGAELRGASGGRSSANTGLDDYLVAHRDGATWLVAVNGSAAAAPVILATGDPVISMGGFNGSDPYPTLAAFKKLVAEGKIRYVLVSSGGTRAAGAGGLGGGGGVTRRAPSGGFPTGPPPGIGAVGPSLRGGSIPSGAAGSGGGSTVAAVDQWVESHGNAVPASAYGGTSSGTLYEVTKTSVD